MIRLKCFHGTSLENGQSIIQENHFRPSDADSLRMGVGAYFFCQTGEDDTYPMRYYLLNKSLSVDPDYKYHNAAVADTQVFDVIRDIRSVAVIRCPQFFGMLEEESRFRFDKGERQFPKTYVPNVIMACVDTDKAIIKDIELVEGGKMFDEDGEFV